MRRTTTTLLAAAFICGSIIARAQSNPLAIPAVSFVNSAANQLVFKGDSSAWERYWAKVDRVVYEGQGQVNVVQFGGSHIQADMWSMEMRQRMQTMVPGIRAGRGFIFPYNMIKSNNPYWYNPEYTGTWTGVRNVLRTDTSTLGIGGASATTRDSLTTLKVSFRGDVYPGYSFNRVKVLHRMDSSFTVDAWSTDPTVSIAMRVNGEEGFTEFTYDHYTDTLHLRFLKADSTQRQFTLRGIILESDDPGIIYHASGINGATTRSWLRCQRFTQELALLKPDLVVFSIGINDAHDPDFDAARYERNYEQLISRAVEASPNTAILLTTNTDSYIKRRTPNRNGEAVRAVMMRLSAKYGCAVWDTFGVMGGQHSIRHWEEAGLAKRDRIHLTRAGYTLLGDLLFNAMMESYGNHLRQSYRP